MTVMIVLYILLGLIALIVILLHISVTVDVCADSKEGVRYSVKYLCFTLYPRKPKPKKKKRKRRKKKSAAKQQTQIAPLDEKELAAELERLDREAELDTDSIIDDDTADEPAAPALTVDSIEPPPKPAPKRDDKQERKLQKELKKAQKAEKKAAKKAAKQAAKEQKHKDDHKPDEEKKMGLIDKFNYYKPLFPMGWKYFRKLLKAVRLYDTQIHLTTAKADAYESAIFYGKLQLALNNALAAVCGIFTVRLKSVGVKCEFNEDKLDYHVSSKVKLRLSTVIAIAVCVLVRYLWFRHKKKKEAKKSITVSSEQQEQKLSA